MQLPLFRATLVQHPEAVEELSNETLLRYARGDFPKVMRWLIRYPALLRALAEDVDAMQQNKLTEEVKL